MLIIRQTPTNTRVSLAALATLFALLCGPAIAQQETPRAPTDADGNLRWVFKPGQALSTESIQNIDMIMTSGANKIESFNVVTTEITTTIDEVDDKGVARASVVIDSMKISSEAPGITFEFDSTSGKKPTGPAAEIARMLTPMIGVTMTQTMDPAGKVHEVEIPDEALSGIENANPIIAGMFSRENFESMVSQGSVDFPESNPEPGFKWDDEKEISMGAAPLVTRVTYIYLGIVEVNNRPLHLIRGSVRMHFPDGINGVPVEVVDEEAFVKIWFDGIAGRLVKSEMEQDITMQFDAGGQQITQNLKQNMSVVVKPAK